jgi:hypothetical protein
VLPREVMNWAGLSNAIGGRVFIDGLEKGLDSHNDSGKTFEQIANAIDEQL